MKLLGSTERRIAKDKNGEDVPHLEIVELVLVRCNLVNNEHHKIHEYCIRSPRANHMVVC